MLARLPRLGYRAGRFVRRHRLATAVGVFALPVVVALAAQLIIDRRKGALQDQLMIELQQMVTAQETFYGKNKRYTAAPTDLDLTLPSGVSVEIVYSSDSSWAAAASHRRVPGIKCVIGVGWSPLTRATPAAEGQSLCMENRELHR